jgi:hypothetical protein
MQTSHKKTYNIAVANSQHTAVLVGFFSFIFPPYKRLCPIGN